MEVGGGVGMGWATYNLSVSRGYIQKLRMSQSFPFGLERGRLTEKSCLPCRQRKIVTRDGGLWGLHGLRALLVHVWTPMG